MLRGVDTLAGAVSVTLGPRGRNVAIDRSFGAKITKDGVSVAREIELGDKFENMGVRMVREIATKASYQAGDGTTTAVVLARAILRNGARAVAAGMNPMDLKRGIDRAVEAVVAELRKNARSCRLERRDRADRHHLGQWRRRGRTHHRRRDGEGRQRRRDPGRGRDEAGERTRVRRGYSVRPQLHLAAFRHQPKPDAGGNGGPLRPHQREQAVQHQRIAAAAGEGRADGQAAAHHRR